MKLTWTLLLAAILMLGTPLLAAAHDNDRRGNSPVHRGWVDSRHNDHHYKDRHRHGDHCDDHWHKKQARKHFKQHVREHRREHRRDHRFAHRHVDHYYAGSAVILSAPRVIFRIDW